MSPPGSILANTANNTNSDN